MHRIFKKKGNLAARGTEGRARRPRRQRPGLEALEGRQLLSLGSEFLVNTTTRNAQFFSDNATASNGLSVAVWGDQSSTTHIDNDIIAQVYNPDGSHRGLQFVVENNGANQQNPKVAMDAFGDFVVTFEETHNGQADIIAQRFKVIDTGAAKVGDRIVIAGTPKNEHGEDVAMDAFGDFVVSYTLDFNAGDQDIRAVQFGISTGLGSSFPVAQSSAVDETTSSVASTLDGRFDIAYEATPHAGGGTRPNLARYDFSGHQLANGPILQLNSFPLLGLNPSVAMDNFGNAVVAFQVTTSGGPGGNVPAPVETEAIRVSSTGSTGDVLSMGFGHSTNPSVALSPGGGSYVVAYDNDLLGVPGHSTVEVTEVSASDARVFVANLPASPNNVAPAVGIDANGNYLLTFTAGFGSNNQDIHGRRGVLANAPQAKNLTMPPSILAGQSATLSGQLEDADGDTNLTLTVDWGDGSKPQVSLPGDKPFVVMHKFTHAGSYTVHVTWTDSTGLSNSRDLTLKVTKAK